MKKFLFCLMMSLSSLACAYDGGYQEVPPIDDWTPPEPTLKEIMHRDFVETVDLVKSHDDFAGTLVGLRIGDEWTVVDRRLEKVSGKKPDGTALDKLIGVAGKASSAKGSLTITYTRVTGYDSEGRPFTESFTIQAGAAFGAAAAAQASMDEATQKQHK